MKKLYLPLFLVLLFQIFFNGCATIIKGYHDKVYISEQKIDMEIINESGINIPINIDSFAVANVNLETKLVETSWNYKQYIKLRSNEKHILTIKKKDELKKIALYPKVSAGWAILDMLFVGLPLVFDLYTGNLNHFDNFVIEDNTEGF